MQGRGHAQKIDGISSAHSNFLTKQYSWAFYGYIIMRFFNSIILIYLDTLVQFNDKSSMSKAAEKDEANRKKACWKVRKWD